jgi:two-component sensor histidine kinase
VSGQNGVQFTKYGAFSVASGKLAVLWSIEDDGLVCLRWIEKDGPLVRKPNRQGFGTKMITGTFATESGWSVDLSFEPSGLRCTMRFYPRDLKGFENEDNVRRADSMGTQAL